MTKSPRAKVKSIFEINCTEVLRMSSAKALCHIDIRDEIKTQFSSQEVEFFQDVYDVKMVDLRKLDKVYLQTCYMPYYQSIAEQYWNLKGNNSTNGTECMSDCLLNNSSSNNPRIQLNHSSSRCESKATSSKTTDEGLKVSFPYSNGGSSNDRTVNLNDEIPKVGNPNLANNKLAEILNYHEQKLTLTKIEKPQAKSSELRYDNVELPKEKNEHIYQVVFGDSVKSVNMEFCVYHVYKKSSAHTLNKINHLIEEKLETNSLIPCPVEANRKIVINIHDKWYRGFIVSFKVPSSVVKLVDVGRYVEVNNESTSCYELPEDPLLSNQIPLTFQMRVDRNMSPGTVALVDQVNNNKPVEAIVLDELGIEDSGVPFDAKPLNNGLSDPVHSENSKQSHSGLVNGMRMLDIQPRECVTPEDMTFKDKAISICSGNVKMNIGQVVSVVDKTNEYLMVSLCSGLRSKPHDYDNIDLLVRVQESNNTNNIDLEHIKEDDYVLVLNDKTKRWHRALLINKKDSLFYLIDTGRYCTHPKQLKRLLNNMLDMPPAVLKIQIKSSLLKFCDVKDRIEIIPLRLADKITIIAQLLLAPRFAIESPPPLSLGGQVKAHFATTDVIDSSISYFFTRIDQFTPTLLEIHGLIKDSTKLINVQAGDYCGIIVQDEGIYCRAKVLKVEDENATVFMLDYGDVEFTETSMCRELPEKVYAYPPCIVKTRPLNSIAHLYAKAEVTLVPQEEVAMQLYSVRVLD